ncbi:MAG TPA: metallopeptidase family protein [Thermaerobacter sp.]
MNSTGDPTGDPRDRRQRGGEPAPGGPRWERGRPAPAGRTGRGRPWRPRPRLRRYRFVPVDWETFTAWAEAIVEGLPPRLLAELEGGVQVDPAARRNPSDPPGVYLLGEYITEPYLGRFIRIYYGSFERVLIDEPPEVWREELEETILHELQHHVEALAGVDWLGIEDLRQLQQLWEEARRGARDDPRGDDRPGDAAQGDDPRCDDP